MLEPAMRAIPPMLFVSRGYRPVLSLDLHQMVDSNFYKYGGLQQRAPTAASTP